jgi:hypothetical protein
MAFQAAISGRVSVEGLKEAQRDLRALGADKGELQEANFEAAQTLIRRAKPLVPQRSGKLLATLKASKSTRGAQANAGSPKRVPYANVIHWGWLVVGNKSQSKLPKGKYIGIAPQPFFSEALGYSYGEIVQDYDKRLQALFNKYNF